MTQSQDTPAGTQDVQNNSNSTSKQLREEKEIKGTPFRAVRLGEEWNLVLGRIRVAQPTKTYEELEERVFNMDWDLLLNVVQAIYDGNRAYEKEIEKAQEILNEKGGQTNE